MIHQTVCACFPRSGHHALYGVLRGYFGDELHYGDAHQNPGDRAHVNAAINYEKNHDFELDLPVRPDLRYLVQVRNPLDSLASWHALNIRSIGEDAAGSLAQWSAERLPYWSGFAKKWLFSPIAHRLVVNYEDLLNRPVEIVTHVVQFMTGTVAIDHAKVHEVLRLTPIVRRSSGNRYPYLLA